MLALPELDVPEDRVHITVDTGVPASFKWNSADKWLSCFVRSIERCRTLESFPAMLADDGLADAHGIAFFNADDLPYACICMCETAGVLAFVTPVDRVILRVRRDGKTVQEQQLSCKLTGTQLAALLLFRCVMQLDNLTIANPCKFDAVKFCHDARQRMKHLDAIDDAAKLKREAVSFEEQYEKPTKRQALPDPRTSLAMEVVEFVQAFPADVVWSLVSLFVFNASTGSPAEDIVPLPVALPQPIKTGIRSLCTWIVNTDDDSVTRFRSHLHLLKRVAFKPPSAA